MPKFNISVPHSLGKDEASLRMKNLIDKVEEKYGDQVSDLEQSWEGDTLNFSFSTFGIKISGAGEVDEAKVDVSGNLPIAAMMFKGKIESDLKTIIEKKLT